MDGNGARSRPGTKTSMATPRQIVVPDIGDFKNVDVMEVWVKPGDAIQPEQSLITVESDKATMEIPSPAAGTVKELRVKVGDKVSAGSLLLVLDAAEGTPAPAAKPAAAPAPVPAPAPAPARAAPTVVPLAGKPDPGPYEPAPIPGFTPHASPSVRKFARELGVDLAKVKGSGPKGRITQEDVQAFVKGVMRGAPAGPAARGGLSLDLPDWPPVDFAKFAPLGTLPPSRV